MHKKLLAPFALALIVQGSSALAAEAARPSDMSRACIDVQIGNDRTAYLECLNGVFERRVLREHQAPQIEAPVDATKSSPTQLGIFNETAARQRMGNAFGVSSVPQRPKPVFSNPIPPLGAR